MLLPFNILGSNMRTTMCNLVSIIALKNKIMADGEIIIYQSEDGKVKLDVILENETVWLTQNQIAELFQKKIRVSERFFYQKIKDIYTTSIDYNPSAESTIDFKKIVQNKLLWAISKETAAKIISRRANAEFPYMGMLSFSKTKGKMSVKIA